MILCRNRTLALVLRIAGTALGIFGLAVMLTASSPGLQLSYYTIQTNIFSVALFFVLSVASAVQIKRSGAHGDVVCAKPSFQLALTFYITITFAVYWSMLSWQNFSMGNDRTRVILMTAANYIVHGVVPLLAIADWLLFMPHGGVRRKRAAAWLIYPAVYAVFIFVRAEIGPPFYGTTRYPYPFIDVDVIGGWVAAVVVAMAVAFFALGLLYIFLDERLAKKLSPSLYALRKEVYVRTP